MFSQFHKCVSQKKEGFKNVKETVLLRNSKHKYIIPTGAKEEKCVTRVRYNIKQLECQHKQFEPIRIDRLWVSFCTQLPSISISLSL